MMGANEKLISEERALAEDLEQFDREDPGWDRLGKIAAARSALRIGMTYEDLISIYGTEITEAAVSAERDKQ